MRKQVARASRRYDMSGVMKRLPLRHWLVAASLLVWSHSALSTEVTLSWTLPSTDCEGNSLVVSDLGTVEVYISELTIPASGAPCSSPSDDPPTGFTPVIVPGGQTTVTLELAAGKTYFFRSRVQGPGGLWSNLSNEATHVIPFIQVQPPTVLIIGAVSPRDDVPMEAIEGVERALAGLAPETGRSAEADWSSLRPRVDTVHEGAAEIPRGESEEAA